MFRGGLSVIEIERAWRRSQIKTTNLLREWCDMLSERSATISRLRAKA